METFFATSLFKFEFAEWDFDSILNILLLNCIESISQSSISGTWKIRKQKTQISKSIQVQKSCTKSCTRERKENQFSTKSFLNDEGKPFLGTRKFKNSSEKFQVSTKKL